MPAPKTARTGLAAIFFGRYPISFKKRLLRITLLLIGVAGLPLGFGWIMIAQPSLVHAKGSSLSVNPEDLEQHVTKLVTDFFPRNVHNEKKLNATADYILKQFRQTGAKVEQQHFTISQLNTEFRNISAHFGPKKGPRIVIGAHYDVYGNLPGADDNASGVAGLIELAKLFAQNPPSTSIELVSWPLEEPPYYASSDMGSAFHARALKKAGVEVKLMISLEMIGYFSDRKNSQRYPNKALQLYYPSTGNFIALASIIEYRKQTLALKKAMRGVTPLPVESINAPRGLPGIDFSDHRNYWDAGYPALMVTDTSFYRNANYHKKTDTIDTLDFDRMAYVVVAVFEAVRNF